MSDVSMWNENTYDDIFNIKYVICEFTRFWTLIMTKIQKTKQFYLYSEISMLMVK